MPIQARLDELGIKLPEAAAPVASYVPVAVHGDLAYVSGQLPFVDGELVTGRLGEGVSLEDGMAAARACGLMILAQLQAARIPLDRVERVIKLLGMVNAGPDFTHHPQVINGCSELFRDVWGEDHGVGARSAFGVSGLPAGACVEIEGILSLRE